MTGDEARGFLTRGREVLRSESDALGQVAERLGEGFVAAVRILLATKGRVFVTGVGKSGIVGRKLAATLSSTGTPAYYLHPVDALHGDLGVIGAEDAAILVSKSGETDELVRMVPALGRLGVPVVLLAADPESSLGRAADAVVPTGEIREASNLELVPTASTTAQLALGDALAVVVMEAKGFRERDFAFLHPGGVIGRTIGRRVRDLMQTGDGLPSVVASTPMREALAEIVRGGVGMTTVVDEDGRLIGVVTDGDLKRLLLAHGDILDRAVGDLMTRSPRTIEPDAPAAGAVERMENNPGGRITALVVVDGDERPLGVVHLHACLGP